MAEIAYKVDKCRICGEPLPPAVMSLGGQTLANNLIEAPSSVEPVVLLDLTACRQCKLVQLTRVVNSDVLFRNYLYAPGFSPTFQQHFKDLAEDATRSMGGGLAVDIGSNDGTLLSKFKDLGWVVAGIEPSEVQARQARAVGIMTLHDYWGPLARQWVEGHYGKADVITATNVFAHVDNIQGFVEQVQRLLKPEGVFILEVPYLYSMFTGGTWDMIYHEHLSYFHMTPLKHLFEANHLRIAATQVVPIHGDSLRVWVQHSDASVPLLSGFGRDVLLDKEASTSVVEDLTQFGLDCTQKRDEVREYVYKTVAMGKRVVGYTAPAKATVLINYCGFTSYHIEYIVDDSPLKVGRFLPGSNIPVVSSSRLEEAPPDVIVVFAWNVVHDILPKLPPNAKVITAMPRLKEWTRALAAA